MSFNFLKIESLIPVAHVNKKALINSLFFSDLIFLNFSKSFNVNVLFIFSFFLYFIPETLGYSHNLFLFIFFITDLKLFQYLEAVLPFNLLDFIASSINFLVSLKNF